MSLLDVSMVNTWTKECLEVVRGFPDLTTDIKVNFLPSEMENFGHQDGWTLPSKSIEYAIHHQGVNFFSWLDRELYLREIKTEWTGIIHNVISYPDDRRDFIYSVEQLVESKNFKNSLHLCKGIYALSKHVANFLRTKVDVPVEVLCHPMRHVAEFNFEKYKSSRKLLNVGQWMRNHQSFCELDVPQHRHIVCCAQWHLEKLAHINQVNVVPRLNNVQYNNAFVDSVFYLDLYDVSACNLILECISSSAPLLVKKLPAVVEYLGEDYPLYFKTKEEAESKLKDDNLILSGHLYLKQMDKSRYSIKRFIKDIVDSSIYKNLPSLTRPLFRWTLGGTSDDGYKIFNRCLESTVSKLGPERFDWIICYNSVPLHRLYKIQQFLNTLPAPVKLYRQNAKDLPLPHYLNPSHNATTHHLSSSGSWWKVVPARLRIDSHEIIMDNDIIFLKSLPEIFEFLEGDKTLVLEDNMIHIGRYEKLFNFANGDRTLNSGIMGLPPGFDFGSEIHKNWEAYGKHKNLVGGDEQGLLTGILKSYNHIRIPRYKVMGLHPHKLCAEAFNSGDAHYNILNDGVNQKKYIEWINYEDVDMEKLKKIACALHFYEINRKGKHLGWSKFNPVVLRLL